MHTAQASKHQFLGVNTGRRRRYLADIDRSDGVFIDFLMEIMVFATCNKVSAVKYTVARLHIWGDDSEDEVFWRTENYAICGD